VTSDFWFPPPLIALTVLFTTLSTMAQELTKKTYNDGSEAHQAEVISVQQNA